MAKAKGVKFLAKYQAQSTAIVTKYQDYKLGKNQPKVNAPTRGSSAICTLSAFDSKDPTKNALVRYSGRALLAKSAAGVTDTILNISDTVAETAKRRPGYKPGRVSIFIPEESSMAGAPAPTQAPEDAAGPTGTGAADSTTKTPLSRITGIEYRRRLGNSYTYPFGSETTNGRDKEEGMMGYLYAQLAKSGRSISFKTEEIPKPTKK